MGYAIVLNFDPETESHIRTLQGALASRGINPLPPGIGIRPHISLAGFDTPNPRPMYEILHLIAEQTPPIPSELAGVGTFPTRQGVVFLTPGMTLDLLHLHERIHTWLVDIGVAVNPLYLPGSWIPHCTVAINLSPEAVFDAIQISRTSPVFRPTTLTEIGLIQYPPLREMCVCPLGRSLPRR